MVADGARGSCGYRSHDQGVDRCCKGDYQPEDANRAEEARGQENGGEKEASCRPMGSRGERGEIAVVAVSVRCMFDTYNEHLSPYTRSDKLAHRGEFEIKTEKAFQAVRFQMKSSAGSTLYS